MFNLSFLWFFASTAEPANDITALNNDETVRDTLELLRHFEGSECTLPPSARVDPSVKQRQRVRLGFFDLWKYVAFIIVKTLAVVIAFLRHYLWGPKRKSWGWEMTFVTSVMQNASDHSHLADVLTLRRLINMVGYAPLPSDAKITPVSFPVAVRAGSVRKRKLRGILSEPDRLESGKRELSGEWVIGRKLWKKLQAEWKAAKNMPESNISTPDTSKKDRVILYLHGGAYYMFSAATHRQLTIQLAKYTESRLFAVDYRLAPEVRFPGQIYDVVSAYMRLLELKVPPENILIAGDSAGGALSLVLLMYLRDNGYPLPSGAILMSPWVDLTMSCDSWDTNAAYDIIAPPKPGDHLNPISCYLGENLEKLVSHPYASPLFGNFHGLPPLLIQAGDSEVLRDELTLLAHKARLAGVHVRYELYEDAVHVFQQFPFLESSKKAFQACRDFVMNDLPGLQERSPQYLGKGAQLELKRETANKDTRTVNGDGSGIMRGSGDSSSSVADDRDGAKPVDGRDQQTPSHIEPVVECPSEPDKSKWTSLRRRFGFTPIKSMTREEHSEPRVRNHRRHATGDQRPHFLTTPAPTIRSRSRTASHPDISSMCHEWANSQPSERSLTYIPASRSRNA